MADKALTAIFASREAAEAARRCLVDAGVSDDRIALSTDLSDDGIAAEAPGQSYANQPGQGGAVDETELYADAARGGGCVLRVECVSDAEFRSLDPLIVRCGAHHARRVG